ncbi:ribonuclease H-like domain-containing protein [Podospora didyma]|uniref:Ribonuclease H-like domain-containing protein n=1 Tax=Podospora didyma TaxID=330526 RepID=A0AAE0NI73_9PEZI|nr:ribonuclease H-like domain-containing protein [Podospora didyma]
MATPNSASDYTLVDSHESVLDLIKVIQPLPTDIPCLFLDLEGVNLCRHGTISLITLFIAPHSRACIIDVNKLQAATFTTAAEDGTTLKTILKSPTITKIFFDVRNDSDALHHHFGVRLAGIEDVQLMEVATRFPNQRHQVKGLAKSIELFAPISDDEKMKWKAIKKKGKKMFVPAKGGSFEVFNERPLSKAVAKYCINDVRFLPQLRNYLSALLVDPVWRECVAQEAANRVAESQSPEYEPHGSDKIMAPKEWRNLN